MPPSLATYQQAAQAVYEPQKAAEAATLGAEKTASIKTLEGGKGQIQTDYQQAVDNLTQQTNQDVGKINQLYTLRLGGNFSGLQGNDLGMMFSNANRQRATIESTRANKLAGIAIEEANTANKYDTQIASLGSKYQGLEADYAYKGYDAAVKDYESNLTKVETASMRGRSGSGGSRSSGGTATPGSQQRSDGGFNFQDANGKAISARLYAQLTGTNFNTLLRKMASLGDSGAADVLKSGGSSKAYKALTWD